MIYPVYCVRDLKADFWQPRLEMNEASARRSFAELIQTSGSMNLFPEDYEYYQIGFFDSTKGVLQPFDIPQLLCRGNEVIM